MPREVWLFFPSTERSASDRVRKAIRAACAARKWSVQERPTRLVRTPFGNTLQIIEPRDAVAVYQRLHRAHVAVVRLDAPRICVEPPEDRAISRELTLSLFRFTQYKAFSVLIAANTAAPLLWMPDFENWATNVHCSNEHDPRCLPFPVFYADATYKELNTPEGRQRFEERHHSKGGRRDLNELRWELNPGAFHAHETLHVAGRPLPKGFHWDVQNDGRRGRISSPLQVWIVKSYVNVFPDGCIRGKHPHARQVV